MATIGRHGLLCHRRKYSFLRENSLNFIEPMNSSFAFPESARMTSGGFLWLRSAVAHGAMHARICQGLVHAGKSTEGASRDIKTFPNTSTDRAEPGTQPVPEQYQLSTEGVLLFVSERAVRWCYSYLNESLTLVR